MKHILVDFDGTLAHTKDGIKVNEPYGIDGPGDPIPEMVSRVKEWLSQGKEVRIFTARVADANNFYTSGQIYPSEQELIVKEWCLKHIGVELPVVCSKDFETEEIWDDRAISVEKNTGMMTTFNV